MPSANGEAGEPPQGNVPPPKKEKGQARRERRAKAAAAASSEDGEAAEALRGGGTVGAYVHISRISDERVEHVEKTYKAGQKVLFSVCVVTVGAVDVF